MDEPTTNVSNVKRGFKTIPRAAGPAGARMGSSRGASAWGGGTGAAVGSNRIAIDGYPASEAAFPSAAPWRASIQSTKTRLGTSTLRTGGPAASS